MVPWLVRKAAQGCGFEEGASKTLPARLPLVADASSQEEEGAMAMP